MFVFNFGKSITTFGFLRFLSSSFVCVRSNQLASLVSRKTDIEDTHLTPAVILFQVEGNNSLVFYHYKQEKICWVSDLVETIVTGWGKTKKVNRFFKITNYAIANDWQTAQPIFRSCPVAAIYRKCCVYLLCTKYFQGILLAYLKSIICLSFCCIWYHFWYHHI